MAMNDYEVQKQINHMIAFIEQEAKEKIEELDAKAEEEFNIEKGRIIHSERLKIIEYYTKKEKAIEAQKRTQCMNKMNNDRIAFLTERQELLNSLIEETRQRVNEMTHNEKTYTKILKNLILEAFYQTMEPQVLVRCREVDVPLVQHVMPNAVRKYTERTETELTAEIDTAMYLPPYCSGGVEVVDVHKKLKVDNTLDSRLDRICKKLEPQIRVALFGKNPNRRYEI
ncbi:unnamed protein product [Hermetia illucens]|uniref:Vacuolar ATP synthase subunit E n=1 Tax=Hermetia illucens TaxID=343691 RepID=A0A7R8V6V2_HERIL|nr:V-type proton ATPase subunit E-like [Hermetia illucens]CAD7093165.1 unnamed protein product [Hermetia illucens]